MVNPTNTESAETPSGNVPMLARRLCQRVGAWQHETGCGAGASEQKLTTVELHHTPSLFITAGSAVALRLGARPGKLASTSRMRWVRLRFINASRGRLR
jgi:hypothetical protein